VSLKKRYSALLLFQDAILTRTKTFEADYRYTRNYLDFKGFDEIVMVDVTLNPSTIQRQNFLGLVTEVSDKSFLPVIVGGGATNHSSAVSFFAAGADRIVCSLSIFDNVNILEDYINTWGSQAVVVSLDYRVEDGKRMFYSNNGRVKKKYTSDDIIESVNRYHPGEILLNCIDRDGSLQGFDVDTLSWFRSRTNVPISIAGGCGRWAHLEEAFELGADCCCTSNIYHLTPESVVKAKSHLRSRGISCR
jgi:cyclase